MNQTQRNPLGPKIVGYAPVERAPRKERTMRGETGIRRGKSGEWFAIRNGRLAAGFTGSGARRLAIREAGTNTVLS